MNPRRGDKLTRVGSTSRPFAAVNMSGGECGVGSPPDVSVGLRPLIINGGGVFNGGESL
jgi:hypothetical protein